MRNACFHLGRRNSPDSHLVIYLLPLGAPQLPRSHENKRRKPQGNPGDRKSLPLIAVDRAKQFADPEANAQGKPFNVEVQVPISEARYAQLAEELMENEGAFAG